MDVARLGIEWLRFAVTLEGPVNVSEAPVTDAEVVQRPANEAAALLGQAAHVLEALRERLEKRQSIYARVFDVLVALVEADRNPEALKALMQEPEDNPDDLEALDRAWAEEQVTFGPDKVGCPKAAAMASRMREGGG